MNRICRGLGRLGVAAILISCTGCGLGKSDPEKIFRDAESAYQQGDFVQAESKAEAGYRRFLSTDRASAGRFRVLQARSALATGKYDQVLAELSNSPSEAFASCSVAARRYMLEAFANRNLGRNQESALSVRRAEAQCASPDPALAADLASMRGVLEDPPEIAERDYLQALASARQLRDEYREAAALLSLGQSTTENERYDESVEWNREALKISKKAGYKLYEQVAEGNLAWDYYKLGDFDQAMLLANEAQEHARILGVGYERIRWRNNLGMLHERSGQIAAAEADYRQALAMARQQQDENQTSIALLELALVSIRAAKWEQAEEFSKEGIEHARQQRDRPLELQGLLAQGLVASHNGDGMAAEKLLSEVAADQGYDRQSFHWEAQAALADLYAKEQKMHAAEAEYRAALETIRQARCSINQEEHRLSFFANATGVYDSYIDMLVQQGRTLAALQAADESRALTLAEGLGIEGKKCLASKTGSALGRDPRRSARPIEATVLFYWLGAEHSYLWAVTPERLKVFPLPAAGQIEPTLEAYRKALVSSREVLESKDGDGAKLYQMLVAPAAELFRPGGRVIVITDGELSELNFETLIAPQPQPHYWIEDVSLQNASSLRLLQAAAPGRKSSANGKLLLMGNALPAKDGMFGGLPHAGEEIGSVKKYFSAADEEIYERQDSTAGAYLASHPEQFSYIHFVAHGTASESDPLDSAVILSPSSPDGSYKLYARDVITRPLNAELVTVSTCQGAGIRSYAGEGLVGLSWAFLHAGAHHVIGALWDVSDESTPQLMDAMYARLVKGSAPDVALREAKLSLLHSGAPFRKPYYWAAFQLYTGS